jgi:1-acyl-sn-glycerol-3-phosphate acyltransferase
LTRVNVQDFLTSFGWENLRAGRKLVEALCWLPARAFAHQMVAFDRLVGRAGLGAAAQDTFKRYAGDLRSTGLENVPKSGPLLVLSNHPGMTDTLALFSSLPRQDLKIIAAERPFLQALPNTSRHLIYVAEEASQRMGVVRATVQHLRGGGAALTFPAGEIEPDPLCMPGAVDSLKSWSDSVAIFARLVPELKILPVIVSGVIWPAALRHPLTRLRRLQKDRERLAAALQVLVTVIQPFYKPARVHVAFGQAISPTELSLQTDPAGLMRVITTQAKALIELSTPTGSAHSYPLPTPVQSANL